MTSRVRALILLTALLWQSLGMLGSFSISQRANALEHLTVHVQDVGHHHHADHALHMDGDDGAIQHIHADGGSGSNVLLVSVLPGMVGNSATTLPAFSSTHWLSPTLEGPLRPPRLQA